MSIEVVTRALYSYKVRGLGHDRWRAICPVCGEKNANTLSIGAASTGAVLLKCFKSECSVEEICAAVGVDMEDLFPPKESHSAPLQRRRMLGAGQALELLHDEAQLIALAASNVAAGVQLSKTDLNRILQAAGRIAYLRTEVLA